MYLSHSVRTAKIAKKPEGTPPGFRFVKTIQLRIN
jgi:hypothetical protein